MIAIYGSPRSSSGRCFWALEEMGLDYEAKAVNFKEKEHKSEAYLKLNPNGKVPVLTDGDYTIWESMAINMYLAEAYKPEFLGMNPKEKGLVYQWSIWSIAELQNPLIEIFIQMVFVPEERRSQEVIDKAKEKLPGYLTTLDSSLAKSKFLVGEEFTLADLNTASVVSLCEHVKFDLNPYKNITTWMSAIVERPAYQKYMELCK